MSAKTTTSLGNGKPPVLLLSHGTTMLAGERSHIRDYWKLQGDEALNYGVKGIIIMLWAKSPRYQQRERNSRARWNGQKAHVDQLQANPDLQTATRCVEMLRAAGFDAVPDPHFNWLIDTYPMIIRMFPGGSPPITIISQIAYFEPHFHVEIGRALRPLRDEGYLFIGSGGGVHNLYRVHWRYNWQNRDTFAQKPPHPPESGNMEFRQALEDALCKNDAGPDMKRAVVRLMKHPNYRDAHGTDEHYMPTCFVAGLCGEEENRNEKVILGAEVWELVNQCETQFSIGEWPAHQEIAGLGGVPPLETMVQPGHALQHGPHALAGRCFWPTVNIGVSFPTAAFTSRAA